MGRKILQAKHSIIKLSNETKTCWYIVWIWTNEKHTSFIPTTHITLHTKPSTANLKDPKECLNKLNLSNMPPLGEAYLDVTSVDWERNNGSFHSFNINDDAKLEHQLQERDSSRNSISFSSKFQVHGVPHINELTKYVFQHQVAQTMKLLVLSLRQSLLAKSD
jgi:hypothetical protein